MKYKVYYSPLYGLDLDNIREYISVELSNPNAVMRIVDGIIESTLRLSEHPESGQEFFLPGGHSSGYRYVLFEQYISFYVIDDNEVYVARAFNTRQNYIDSLL